MAFKTTRELNQLRKELEERDTRLEELSQVWKELEKKDSNLKLAQDRLKEVDSTLQRAFGDKEAALEKWNEVKPSVQRAVMRRRWHTRWLIIYSLRWKRRGLLPVRNG